MNVAVASELSRRNVPLIYRVHVPPAPEKIEGLRAEVESMGFSPGDSGHPEPYFYSNPWPFEKEVLLDKLLPEGARWFTEGWEGSLLEYSELVGDPRGEERLLSYARAVYELAAPTLMGQQGR